MMVIYAAGGLAFLLAAIYATGALLPREHVAAVTEDYAAPPERIWATITDAERFTEWRSGLKKVEVAGERITEHASFGPMSYRFVNATPPHRVTTDVDLAGAEERGFAGSWTFEIAPQGSGSRLTITERGQVFSPVFRVMARFVFGYESTLRQYHKDLAKRLTPAG